MSCSGHCNVCVSHAGYDPPLSAPTWLDDGLGTGINVKNEHFDNLRDYIQTELTRRSASPPASWPPAYKDTDDIIYAIDYRLLRDAIVNCKAWTPTWASDTYLVAGGDILDESTNEMRDRMATLRAECLCNCNYACTCNCNYCTCNCNYACTCDCNYSDKRLKENIVYI